MPGTAAGMNGMPGMPADMNGMSTMPAGMNAAGMNGMNAAGMGTSTGGMYPGSAGGPPDPNATTGTAADFDMFAEEKKPEKSDTDMFGPKQEEAHGISKYEME